jgi:hypothetical protein
MRCNVRVQRIGLNPERDVLLKLSGRGAQHQAAPRLGTAPKLFQQMRLADPGLALDRHSRRLPGGEQLEHLIQTLQLGNTPNKFRRATHISADTNPLPNARGEISRQPSFHPNTDTLASGAADAFGRKSRRARMTRRRRQI